MLGIWLGGRWSEMENYRPNLRQSPLLLRETPDTLISVHCLEVGKPSAPRIKPSNSVYADQWTQPYGQKLCLEARDMLSTIISLKRNISTASRMIHSLCT